METTVCLPEWPEAAVHRGKLLGTLLRGLAFLRRPLERAVTSDALPTRHLNGRPLHPHAQAGMGEEAGPCCFEGLQTASHRRFFQYKVLLVSHAWNPWSMVPSRHRLCYLRLQALTDLPLPRSQTCSCPPTPLTGPVGGGSLEMSAQVSAQETSLEYTTLS
ncbi:hypothetical protein NDU88_007708 [Pleurodeles waltl]|uniref:Uncharacterized protein n=1 Tax=Pleurodeles waltl TaxID=8319 RepID=A0AAV7STI4_PLEWA|nr:hypothetical protein NDU88_007708 [Pleurodeles waltl]